MTPNIDRGLFGFRGRWAALPAWMGLIAFLHAVGLAGVVLYDATTVLNLTVLNLLFSTLIVLGFGDPDNGWRWALTAYVTYAVEVIGVQTGFPFGDYAYGWRLGPHIYDTPPMIGVLWLVTLSGAAYWSHRLLPEGRSRSNRLSRAAVAATFMLALDLIMEPVAMMADFWNWTGDIVPVRNYVAWWAIAFALAWAWGNSRSFRTNRAAGLLLLIQAIFFIGLLLLPWTS